MTQSRFPSKSQFQFQFQFILLLLSFNVMATIPWVPIYYTQPLLQFSYINFSFTDSGQVSDYFNNNKYKDVIIEDLAVSYQTKQVFVALPRYRANTFATLCVFDYEYYKVQDYDLNAPIQSPNLVPFPNPQLNDPSDNLNLVSITSLTITPDNVLWALDSGRIAFQAATPHSLKIVSFNIQSASLMERYFFDVSLYDLNKMYLSSMVIDSTFGRVYISNSGLQTDTLTNNPTLPLYSSLLCYNLNTRVHSTVYFGEEWTNPKANYSIYFNGDKVWDSISWKVGAFGIGVSSDLNHLYWSSLTSDIIYSIPTKYLWDKNGNPIQPTLNPSSVLNGFNFSSQFIASTNANSFVLGSIHSSEIYIYDSKNETMKNITAIDQNSIQWPSGFGFDHNKWVLITSNNLGKFLQNQIVFPSITDPFIPQQDGFPIFNVTRIYVGVDNFVSPNVPDSESNGEEKKLISLDHLQIFAIILGSILIFLCVYIYVVWRQVSKEPKQVFRYGSVSQNNAAAPHPGAVIFQPENSTVQKPLQRKSLLQTLFALSPAATNFAYSQNLLSNPVEEMLLSTDETWGDTPVALRTDSQLEPSELSKYD